jgi:hypothetical protein
MKEDFVLENCSNLKTYPPNFYVKQRQFVNLIMKHNFNGNVNHVTRLAVMENIVKAVKMSLGCGEGLSLHITAETAHCRAYSVSLALNGSHICESIKRMLACRKSINGIVQISEASY